MAKAPPFIIKIETAYMEVPFCRTCKWWAAHGAEFTTGDCRIRESASPLMWVRDEGDDETTSLGTPFHAICTDERFGCTQHESREGT